MPVVLSYLILVACLIILVLFVSVNRPLLLIFYLLEFGQVICIFLKFSCKLLCFPFLDVFLGPLELAISDIRLLTLRLS